MCLLCPGFVNSEAGQGGDWFICSVALMVISPVLVMKPSSPSHVSGVNSMLLCQPNSSLSHEGL